MRHVGSTALYSAFIVFSLALIGCGKQGYNTDGLPAPSGRLVVETHDYKGVVMVILPGGTGLCTGTFISERAVLTAAHCALQAGEYDVVTDWGTYATHSVVKLGPGVVNDPNDIAILMFSTDVASRNLDQVYDIDDSVFTGDTLRLVGFGCTNITSKDGAGVKRTGTNVVDQIDDYVDFLTPNDNHAYGILGPDNLAGSCFGDSGGPALRQHGSTYKIAAVTHAGGTYGDSIVSEYVNVASNSTNRNWIHSVNQTYNLNIAGF